MEARKHFSASLSIYQIQDYGVLIVLIYVISPRTTGIVVLNDP